MKDGGALVWYDDYRQPYREFDPACPEVESDHPDFVWAAVVRVYSDRPMEILVQEDRWSSSDYWRIEGIALDKTLLEPAVIFSHRGYSVPEPTVAVTYEGRMGTFAPFYLASLDVASVDIDPHGDVYALLGEGG